MKISIEQKICISMSSTSLYFLSRNLTKKFFQSYFDRLYKTYGFHALDRLFDPAVQLFINNHSVTFTRNPILFNCSQGFTRNFGISQLS